MLSTRLNLISFVKISEFSVMLEEPQKMPKARMRENIYNTCCRRRLIKFLANTKDLNTLKTRQQWTSCYIEEMWISKKQVRSCFSSTLTLNWDTVSAITLPTLIYKE